MVIDNAFDIAGKLALVTGSARGLGNTYARGLAAAGCDIVLTAATQTATRSTPGSWRFRPTAPNR